MQKTPALAALLAFSLASGALFAQDSASRAEAMFRAGRDAMRDGDFARACEQFRESDRLDPQPGTKLNLGACEEKRGRLATALDLFKVVLRELPENDPRYPIARERVQELDTKIPRVTFQLAPGAPAATRVQLGTIEVAGATLGVALPVDPGKHQVTVSAPGFADKRFVLELGEKDRRSVEVAPGPKEGDVALTSSTPVADSSGESGSRTLGYIFGGVGVAGVIVGSVAGVMVLNKKQIEEDECDDDLQICSQKGADAQDAGRTLGVVSTLGFVVGAVGLGAGAYFLLSSDDGGAETGVAVRARPHGTFLSLERTW